MERVGVLVNRLFEQYQQNESPERLLITIQLLLGELQQMKKPPASSSQKVAVVLPANLQNAYTIEETTPVANGVFKENPEAFSLTEENKISISAFHEAIIDKVNKKWGYDPLRDVPTLAHQNKELNEIMTSNEESLNEKLKMEKRELGSVLKETPIADLRKAIGINDRFLFINELFGGDGTTYERCLQTINAFKSFSEAEYWIRKELKLKLGWPENSATVRYFDHLVKRRFS